LHPNYKAGRHARPIPVTVLRMYTYTICIVYASHSDGVRQVGDISKNENSAFELLLLVYEIMSSNDCSSGLRHHIAMVFGAPL
jgi:hypothetical protein